ncbi:hypothetical protein M8J77_007629 [Diaphorina citri]|nr:hypothetical protein M8J77_007629 [Diaphorina citri]
MARGMEYDVDNNKKVLFGMVKNKRRDREQCKNLTNENGNLLTDSEYIKKEWSEYFMKLLNVTYDVEEEDNNLETEEDTESEEEREDLTWSDIDYVWKFIKTGKAAGIDDITGEMIKNTGIAGKHWLYRLFRTIWMNKNKKRAAQFDQAGRMRPAGRQFDMPALDHAGIEKPMIERISDLYKDISSKVRTPVGTTDNFAITTGLRPCDVRCNAWACVCDCGVMCDVRESA